VRDGIGDGGGGCQVGVGKKEEGSGGEAHLDRSDSEVLKTWKSVISCGVAIAIRQCS
jgi:hypothetical protein